MPDMNTNTNVVAAQWTTAYVNGLPDSSFAYIASDGTRHLPYKGSDGKVDLPHVRNALARLNQVKGMSDTDRAQVKSKLQGALKNTQAADDARFNFVAPIQAAANNTEDELPTRMMLLRSGNFNTQKYGEIPLEASDLEEMAANFKAGVGMAGDGTTGIPVDYSHESHKNAGAWIKAMEVVKDADGNAELWATDLEFSDSGKQAIKGKEYKCLSSDFYPKAFGEWVDPESGVAAQNVIVGAAFTNRPMFSGNQPVTASEENKNEGGGQHTVFFINANQEKEKSMNIDTLRVKAADEVTGPEQRFLQANVGELSADEQKKFELVVPTQASDDKDKPKQIKASEIKGDEGKVVVEASELKEITDKVSTLEAGLNASEHDKVKADVQKHAARGAIKADRIESWTKRIVAADAEGRKEIMADLEALADNPVLAKEQGSGDGDEGNASADARTELMDKAKKVMAESGGKKDIQTALAEVKASEPELAERAAEQRKAQIGAGVTASDEQFKAAGVNRG